MLRNLRSLLTAMMWFIGWWIMFCEAQTFEDIASEQSINAIMEGNPHGGGISFYDFNDDGWDDLSFTAANDSCYFYLNNEGSFEEVPSFVFGSGNLKSLLWVDYDNDGDADLFVTSEYHPLKLLENQGDFDFVDVSFEAGLPVTEVRTNGASFGDFNNDGCLDLYVCSFEAGGDEDDYNRQNHLYRNNCDGTFTDVTLQAGVSNGFMLSFQGAWLDYDRDGWQDIYVINDRWFPNTMYRNNGDGTFSNVSTISGTGIIINAMSTTVADYDNDQDLDIYVTNGPGGNKLLQNNNDGTFDDVSDSSGDMFDLASWGASWIDHDNNGWLDLYVCTAIFQSWDSILDNRFYINDQAIFTESNDLFLSDHTKYSFSSAVGDIDNDGFSDIAVHNYFEATPFVWLNSGSDSNFIKVSLEGVVSNNDGIGSWIEVFCDENIYTRYTMCGQDYLGQSSQHQIIGVGDAESIDSLRVTWLSGIVDTFYELEPNQNYLIEEGMSIQPEIQVTQEDSSLCMGDTALLQLENWSVQQWSNGSGDQSIEVTQSGEYWASVEYNGFTFNSDTVLLTFNPPPSSSLSITEPTCFAEQDGTIMLENANGNGILSVTWTFGEDTFMGDEIWGLSAGNYQYNMVDWNGCAIDGLVQLQQPDSLYLNCEVEDELYGEDGSVFIEVFGGTAPYSIQWGDDQLTNLEGNTHTESQLSGGSYDVTVFDANECSISHTLEIDFIESIGKDSIVSFAAYPNPVTSTLTLAGLKPEDKVTVFNMIGELLDLPRSKVENDLILDFSRLNTGSYAVRVYQADCEGRVLKILKD